MVKSDPQDGERLAKAISGDETALADLFEHYRPRLRRMVIVRMDARVRARLDASDVVQEAFVDVARQIGDYREKYSSIPFFLWLRMVTGGRLAQLHRRHLDAKIRTADREISMRDPAMPAASSVFLAAELAGQFTSVDRGLKLEESTKILEEALNSMDRDDRDIISMRHYEELTTEEIAAELKLTRSGVLKRYTRALRRLTTSIGNASDFSA